MGLVLEFREIGAGSHQNQGALTSGGERFDLVGDATAVNQRGRQFKAAGRSKTLGESPTRGTNIRREQPESHTGLYT